MFELVLTIVALHMTPSVTTYSTIFPSEKLCETARKQVVQTLQRADGPRVFVQGTCLKKQ